MRSFALVVPAALVFAGSLSAQTFTTGPCPNGEGEGNGHGWPLHHQAKVCEVRKTTLPLTGRLDVEGTNGGIDVIGEDRRDIALEARVEAQAPDRERAQALVRAVHVKTDGTIEADGPRTSGSADGNWSVNYKLRVPRHLAAHLLTRNGGISVDHIEGKIEVETTNGGLALRDLGGDVHATTVNGGLDVTLHGTQWQGAGLDARSTNGGVSVKAPEHYSAHLVADTTHGGVSIDFPTSDQGKHRNHVDTNLGQGGPTLHFETVNGGVSVGRD